MGLKGKQRKENEIRKLLDEITAVEDRGHSELPKLLQTQKRLLLIW